MPPTIASNNLLLWRVQSQKHTAILLFAESNKRLIQKKTLHGAAVKNFKLVKHLNDKAAKTAHKSGLDIIQLDESQQTGQSFGDRLTNAVESIFLKGYERLIVIGNDCPDLTPADLRKTNVELEMNDLVLGPDQRGGTYLIGLNRSSFVVDKFRCLAWQKKELCQTFASYAKDLHASIRWMSQKVDFNHSDEIKSYSAISAGIRKLISQLIDQVAYFDVATNFYAAVQLETNSRRGPPQLI